MDVKSMELNKILETIDNMDIDDQSYILEILYKRIIESKRREIAKLARESERNYKKGKVKKGTVEDLWKDLND